MAIYAPGRRTGKKSKRNAVVVLNMTAMVDMFTVLCVFLLQNYATTNQVLPMPDKVELPMAKEVKELKPSNVVIIAQDGIMLNNTRVADFAQVKGQEDWLVKPLSELLAKQVADGEAKKKTLGSQIRTAVQQAKVKPGEAPAPEEKEIDEFRKVTIQSDKMVDFLTVKKVMYTVTEAGMLEINFAVMKKEGEAAAM